MIKYWVVLIFMWFSPHAFAYTSLTVFGDSFFDGGDADTAVISYYKLFGSGVTDSPYSGYRFTNGPSIAEYLAINLNVNNTGQFFNYAVGGATTSEIKQIVQHYGSSVDNQGLYLINGGGNDLAFGISTQEAVQNILDVILILNNAGAKNFLVMNLPIGKEGASLFADFNTQLDSGLTDLRLTSSTHLAVFDLGAQLPDGNEFINTVDACFDGVNVCANPDEYVFWDHVHFTTRLHALIAQEMTEVLSAVPEPETYTMLLAGLSLLGFATNRKRG